ncbi:MAG: hypothetical protein EXX96DRAFT_456803, partial [Benjaminiella poitrasii]
FLEAKDRNSIAIAAYEFDGMDFREKSLNTILREQYPKGVGLRECYVTRTKQYIELNFASVADRDKTLQKPFLLFGKTILVCTTLDKNAHIYLINISNIHHDTEDILKPNLLAFFSQYGDFLELGLRYIADGGWFNGHGYVTLNCDKTKTYARTLAPQILSWEQEHMLHLVWKDMQFICRRCHADTHTSANCP